MCLCICLSWRKQPGRVLRHQLSKGKESPIVSLELARPALSLTATGRPYSLQFVLFVIFSISNSWRRRNRQMKFSKCLETNFTKHTFERYATRTRYVRDSNSSPENPPVALAKVVNCPSDGSEILTRGKK